MRVRAAEHALGRAGLAGNDQIVPAQVKLLQSQGHERQVELVMPDAPRQALDKGRADGLFPQQRRKPRAIHAVRVDVGLRVQTAESFQNLLAAPHAYKPVMNQCDAHIFLQIISYIHL